MEIKLVFNQLNRGIFHRTGTTVEMVCFKMTTNVFLKNSIYLSWVRGWC